MGSWEDIIFEYVCPVGGCLLASSVFAAPIRDLNGALRRGSLGSLNTVPWAVMTGNCLGWCAYAYYTADPFVLASNLPGLILSLWLNIGACKLQYLAQIDFHGRSSSGRNDTRDETLLSQKEGIFDFPTSSQQDVLLLRIISLWAVVLVCVGWLDGLFRHPLLLYDPHIVVGLLVNINLVFFYGAPLQTMKTVLESRSSDTIHTPTVTMNVINALFWMSYGFARNDAIIYGPNGVGLLLGIAQCVLCCAYPKRGSLMPGDQEVVEFEIVPPCPEDHDLSLREHDGRRII